MPTVTLRGMKLSGTSVTKPDGAPAYWQTVMKVDHTNAQVSFYIRGGQSIIECNAGVDNYTVQAGSQNTDHAADLDNTRVGQLIWFTDKLPSTNDHDYSVRLVSKSGDARTLTCALINPGRDAADSNRVMYVHIELRDGSNTPVAPAVNGIYTFEITFRKIL